MKGKTDHYGPLLSTGLVLQEKTILISMHSMQSRGINWKIVSSLSICLQFIRQSRGHRQNSANPAIWLVENILFELAIFWGWPLSDLNLRMINVVDFVWSMSIMIDSQIIFLKFREHLYMEVRVMLPRNISSILSICIL